MRFTLMPPIPTIKLNFAFLIIFFSSILLSYSQNNTHQTIVRPSLPLFNIPLRRHDQLKVVVYNTVSQVSIGFVIKSKKFQTGITKYCFMGDNVTLEHTSQWNAKGFLAIDIQAYQYSYEITINGTVWSKRQNFVTNFIENKFIYSKSLKVKTYDIKVIYHSNSYPQITMKFNDLNYSVLANQLNIIKVDNKVQIPLYSISFQINQKSHLSIEEAMFEVTIEIPNELLKGCDGTNAYDSQIRACPSKTSQELDSLQLHKIGSYPIFSVLQSSKVNLKITILQVQKWKQFAPQPLLKVILAKDMDLHLLKDYNYFDTESGTYINQTCTMKSAICNFIFKLQPGNYTMIPMVVSVSESFVYLLQRMDGTRVVESFYSFLPLYNSASNNSLIQMGGLVEFSSHKEKLTEIIFESEERFLLFEYAIFGRSKTQKMFGNYKIQFTQVKIDGVFNPDPHKASIYIETQPESLYLIMFMVISEEKFKHQQQDITITSVSDNEDDDKIIQPKRKNLDTNDDSVAQSTDNNLGPIDDLFAQLAGNDLDKTNETQVDSNFKLNDLGLDDMENISGKAVSPIIKVFDEDVIDPPENKDISQKNDSSVDGNQQFNQLDPNRQKQQLITVLPIDEIFQPTGTNIGSNDHTFAQDNHRLDDLDVGDLEDDGNWEFDGDLQFQINESNGPLPVPKARIQTTKIVLQTDLLQISIKNGKFPHKKLQEPTLAQIIASKNKPSSISPFASLPVTVVILLGVIGGVFLLILLVFVGCKIKAKVAGDGTEGKQLVEENQTSSVNVESASGSTHTHIEISQIATTEQLN